jgi:2-polyprenyl-6-methoxyphenol hydroxylase-like FAD-dependent oxidoreductase
MPIKTLLLPAHDFRTDSDVTLLSSNATYRMRLSEPIQQQFEYVWTSFAFIDDAAQLPSPAIAQGS